jgi:hypothetical protein
MEVDAAVDTVGWQIHLQVAEPSDATHLRVDDTSDEPSRNGSVDRVPTSPEGRGPRLDRLGLRRHHHAMGKGRHRLILVLVLPQSKAGSAIRQAEMPR